MAWQHTSTSSFGMPTASAHLLSFQFPSKCSIDVDRSNTLLCRRGRAARCEASRGCHSSSQRNGMVAAPYGRHECVRGTRGSVVACRDGTSAQASPYMPSSSAHASQPGRGPKGVSKITLVAWSKVQLGWSLRFILRLEHMPNHVHHPVFQEHREEQGRQEVQED